MSAGVRVALGTDSRASNPDLSIWREVQYLLQHRSDLNPHTVVAMATTGGADALGRPDLGRIEAECKARFGFVTSNAESVDDLFANFANNEFQPG